MKVIQVGIGDFGFSWLKDVLLEYEGIQIIGIVDKNQELLEKAKGLLQLQGTILYTDLAVALNEHKPNFILNCTPPAIHKEINNLAIEHHIPILSEKPIAIDFQEAKEIFKKSLEADVPIMIAENYRYQTIVRTIKNLFSSEEIGKIDRITIDFYRKHRMFNYHKDLKYPLLSDVTMHHLDMIRYLTDDDGKTVFAKSWAPEWSWYKDHSTLELLINLEKNIKVSYRGSLSAFKSNTDWLGNWMFEGVKGVITLSHGKIRVYKENQESEIAIRETYDSRKYVLDEFITALTNGHPGETDIQDNIKTFKLADAAIRSINNCKLITL